MLDVTGFNEKTWLVGSARSTAKLRVIERYTRGYDTIRYQATMEDQEVFTKPWQVEERSGSVERADREYECIENNEDLLRIEKPLQNEKVFRKRY